MVHTDLELWLPQRRCDVVRGVSPAKLRSAALVSVFASIMSSDATAMDSVPSVSDVVALHNDYVRITDRGSKKRPAWLLFDVLLERVSSRWMPVLVTAGLGVVAVTQAFMAAVSPTDESQVNSVYVNLLLVFSCALMFSNSAFVAFRYRLLWNAYVGAAFIVVMYFLVQETDNAANATSVFISLQSTTGFLLLLLAFMFGVFTLFSFASLIWKGQFMSSKHASYAKHVQNLLRGNYADRSHPPAFLYSSRFLTAMVGYAIALMVVVIGTIIVSAVIAAYEVPRALASVLNLLLGKIDTDLQEVKTSIVLSLSLAVLFTVLIHGAVGVIIFLSHRRRMLQMRVGRYFYDYKRKPIRLVTGCAFPIYQMAYALLGGLITWLLLVLVFSVSLVILNSSVLRSAVFEWLASILSAFIASYIAQLLLYRFVTRLVTDESRSRVINLRRFMNFELLLLFLSAFSAVIGLTLRLIGFGLHFTLNVCRLDSSVLPEQFASFDSGYTAYLASAYLDHCYQSCPVVVTAQSIFVELYLSVRKQRVEVEKQDFSDPDGDGPPSTGKSESLRSAQRLAFSEDVEGGNRSQTALSAANVRRRRIVNYWFICYTLVRNPELKEFRIHNIQATNREKQRRLGLLKERLKKLKGKFGSKHDVVSTTDNDVCMEPGKTDSMAPSIQSSAVGEVDIDACATSPYSPGTPPCHSGSARGFGSSSMQHLPLRSTLDISDRPHRHSCPPSFFADLSASPTVSSTRVDGVEHPEHVPANIPADGASSSNSFENETMKEYDSVNGSIHKQ